MGRLALVLSALLIPFASARPADQPTNRLVHETSPYLRQHAHNPVDWYPWGPEAFAKAQKEQKYVFLSIGYSSCHWCHVMEKESFSDPEVAKLLNASFVCIKVDREERPDVDQIYMTALQVFRQPGGWPLSMFLTADGKPIAGGTYWPPDDRMVEGQKVAGLKSVLRTVLDLQRDKPKEVAEQADQVAKLVGRLLSRSGRPTGPEPRRFLVAAAVDGVKAEFDAEYGGFGNPQKGFKGPKFPLTPYLDLLLEVARREKSVPAVTILTRTLDRMAEGGIYDHLGGGFHRYSTERTWTVPHFEKMLYDNAQLVQVYAGAFESTKNPNYRRVVEETLEFVGREMTAPEGGFYSALDADSEGEEGRFYLWTSAEFDAALPDAQENSFGKQHYGLTGPPFVEGKSYVLTRRGNRQPDHPDVRRKLFAARAKRQRPGLDTKVLTAWNGQMIAGYAVAGRLLGERRYVDTGARAADFVLSRLRTNDGRLLRTYGAAPGGPAKATLTAYLDDYTHLTHGLLCLHDADASPRWLSEARGLTDQMIRHYADDAGGGFYYTADDHEKLFARAKEVHDGAQPSGNSVAVHNLLRLAAKTGEAKYRDLAGKALRAFAVELEQNPSGMTAMAAALEQYLDGAPSGQPVSGQPGGGAKRSDAVVKAAAKADKPAADGKQTVTVTLTVDNGWHVYANPVGNETLDSAQTQVLVAGKVKPKAVKVDYPKGNVVKDMLVGDYKVYEGKVEIKATVERAAGDTGPLEVTVKLQACNEKTCLLPATIKLTVP